MFKWLDEKINDYFENKELDKKKKIDDERLVEIETKEKLNRIRSEAQSKLETHCNLHFEMSKQKYEKKMEEFNKFLDESLERFKVKFTEEFEKQDFKKVVRESFTNYIGSYDFSLKPKLVKSRNDVVKLNLMKSVSLDMQKSYHGGENEKRSSYTQGCAESIKYLLTEQALELGAKMGAELLFIETVSSEVLAYSVSDYGTKKVTIGLVITADFYTCGKTISNANKPSQDIESIENLMLGVHELDSNVHELDSNGDEE